MADSQDSQLPASYAEAIDSILASSDIQTISVKATLLRLQDVLGIEDLSSQKAEIKKLILARFDAFAVGIHNMDDVNDGSNAASNVPAKEPPSSSSDPGSRVSTDATASSTPAPTTPKKRAASGSATSSNTTSEANGETSSHANKKSKNGDHTNSDAALAAKLQTEENGRTRSTRASRSAATSAKRKPAKVKTPKKVAADSEPGTNESPKKVNRNTGFHKPLNVSPALSTLLGGETTVSRPQAVKGVWNHIREYNLQDPSDKRQIVCDEPMRAVFKQDRVNMFAMTKILNQNLYNPGE